MPKRKKKKVISKLGKDSQDEKVLEQSTQSAHHDTPDDDVEAERIVRKSTRTSVIVRQAERDAIRAALQATMKVCWNFVLDKRKHGMVNELLACPGTRYILIKDWQWEKNVIFVIISTEVMWNCFRSPNPFELLGDSQQFC